MFVKTRKSQVDRITLENLQLSTQAAQEAYDSHDFEHSEQLVRQIIASSKSFPPALLLLGRIACATGRPELGTVMFRRAFKADETAYRHLRDLAMGLKANGTLEAVALCEQMVRLMPDSAEDYSNLGKCLVAVGRFQEGLMAYQRALVLEPFQAGTYHEIGTCLQNLGRSLEAIRSFSRAIELDPDSFDSYLPLGTLHLQAGDRGQAIHCFRRAYERCPDSPMGRLQLARAYFEEGKFSDLEPLLKDLCSFEETSVEATLLWANMQRRLGHFVAAKTQFMSVAQALPDRDDAILGAVYSGKLLSSEGQLLNQLKQALAAASYGSGRAKSLHFALGKAFDDLGEYEAAISHFDAGHKLALMEMKSAGASFRPETYAAEVDSYIQLFGPELAERPAPTGSASERPIFIVGFPRSGTTLVEQILSSHPDVAAGGEIHFWPQASACLFANEIVGGRLEAAGCLVERYMGILSGISAHSRRVTDKQPDNYRHLGLIHWLFPNARIIHCRRHPLDTCLSIYMTAFQNSIDYSHDRCHLAFAYRNYRKLMDHWRSMVPPPRLFELNYERLASNKEQPIRDLVEFCGLDWSDACLLPHENPGAVATPSMWQVRQPIYQTSVDRWRNYSPWLGELNSLADYF